MPPILLPLEHTQQREMGDCLAACADMALRHIGRPTSYRRLIRLLRINEFGTPFSNIKRLEKLNVIVERSRGTIDILRAVLHDGYPPIVSVVTDDLPYWSSTTYHALVVAGLDDKNLQLYDPAFLSAPITVSIGNFDLAWLQKDEAYAVIRPRS